MKIKLHVAAAMILLTFGMLPGYASMPAIQPWPPCLSADAPTLMASSPTVCAGSSVTLSITGGNLNSNTDWQWYSISCGGTPVGTGTSVVVNPTTATTYFVRGEGVCVDGPCSDISISVNPLPTPTILAGSTTTFCAGDSVILHTELAFDAANSAVFNGSADNYIDANNNNLSDAAGTMECWAKVNSTTDFQLLFDAGGEHFVVLIWAGDIYFRAGGTQFSYPDTLTAGQWYHFAMTWNGSGNVFHGYINGQEVNLTAGTNIQGSTPLGINGIRIGESTSHGPDPFFGEVDEFRAYDRMLSQTEIQETMNYYIDPATSGLKIYFNFDTDFGTTCVDQTANGNNGTLMNGTSFGISTAPVHGNPSAATFLWSSLETTSSITVNASGNYSVAAIHTATGCTDVSTATNVLVNSLPAAVTGSTATICNGASATLGDLPVGGNAYSWSPTTGLSDATISNPVASPLSSTTYALTETVTATGCQATNRARVLTGPKAPVITGIPYVCPGGSTTLTCVSTDSTHDLRFNGSNQCVSIPDDPSITLTDQLTIEFWMNMNSTGVEVPLTKWDDDGNNRGYLLIFGYNSPGELTIFFDNDGTFGNHLFWNTGLVLNAHEWHHVAVTFNSAGGANNVNLYLDGALFNQNTWGFTIFPSLANMLIGGYDGAGNGLNAGPDSWMFDGRMDEVRIWNVERSAGEVSTDAAAPVDPTSAGLVSYYNFNEGSGTVAADLAGHNNGTLINSPTWTLSDDLAIDGNSVLWSDLSTTTSIATSSLTSYTVQISSYTGCVSDPSPAVLLAAATPPTVQAGSDAIICLGGSTTLGVTGLSGHSYSWSPNTALSNNLAANPTAGPNVNTDYILTETIDSTGCVNMDTVSITVSSPHPTVLGTCDSLMTGIFTDYLWSFNGISTAQTTQEILSSQEGPYHVTVHDSIGCIATSLDFHRFNLTDPVVSTSDIFCSGVPTINLSTSDTGAIYFLFKNPADSLIGSPQDGTGSGLNFTAPRITTTSSYYISAQQSTAVKFDGGGYLPAISGPSNIPSGNSNYTIEAWVKLDAMGDHGIAGWGNYGLINQANAFRFYNNGLSNYWWGNDLVVGTADLSGQWHHVAATFDGTTRIIYLDGVNIGSDNPGGGHIVSADNFTVGKTCCAETFFGTLDEVRIWNVARTQLELQNTMYSHLTGSEAGLMAYYDFEGSIGDDKSLDKSGHGNDLVASNLTIANMYVSSPIGSACDKTLSPNPVTAHIVSLTDIAPFAVDSFACGTAGTSIYIPNSDPGISYVLRDDANDTLVAGPVTGNGDTISLATGVTSVPMTYNVLTLRSHALQFDGTDDYLEYIVNSPETDYTYELWFRTTDPNAAISSVWDITLAGGVDRILTLTGGDIRHYMFNSETITSSGLTLSDGAWHHAAVVVESGVGQTIYVDGVSVATGTLDHSDFNTDAVLLVGFPENGNSFNGQIDDIRMYDTPRTSVQIQSDMNSHLNGNEANLIHYFDLEDGAGSSAIDLVSGEYVTLVNMDITTSWVSSDVAVACSMELSHTISINHFPAASVPTILAGGPTAFCTGDSVELTSSAASSYLWSDNVTTIADQIHSSGSYTVTTTDVNGCRATSAPTLIIAHPLPDPSFTVSQNPVCSGLPVDFISSTSCDQHVLEFDGADDVVTIPETPSLDFTDHLTIETWIYPTASGNSFQNVICKSSNASNDGYIFPRTEDTWSNLLFYMHIGGNWQGFSTPYPAINEWHHVAATYDGANVYIYIDGTQVYSNSFSGTIDNNANDLAFGSQPGYGEYYQGKLDEVKIWNTARTQTEIQADMNDCGVITAANLVANYHFTEGAGSSTIHDVSGNGNNGSLNNFDVNTAWTIPGPIVTTKTFTWDFGDTNSDSLAFASHSFASSNTFPVTLTVIDSNLCSSVSAPLNLLVNAVPAADAGSDVSICLGASISLGNSAVSGNTYSWAPTTGLDDGTSSAPNANPSATTTYTLTEQTTATGCINSSPVQVTLKHTPVPEILAFSPTTFCAGDSVSLYSFDAGYHDAGGTDGASAVSFYGDYINGTQTGLSEAAGTVSCWVYVGSTTDAQVAYDLGGAHNFILYIWNDGHIYMNAAGGQFLINDTLTAGNWYHFAMTWSGLGTQFKGYINGHLINGDIVGGSDIQGGNSLDPNFNLGRAGDTNYPLQGGMDEFRAYNRVLSQEEIQSTMYQTIPANTPGLKMYFQFNEGSGSTTTDISLHGNDGPLSSSGMWTASTAPVSEVATTSFLWSNADTTFTSAVNSANSYHATLTNITSGCSATSSDSVITVNPLPLALAGSNKTICEGSSTTIGDVAVGGNSYAWLPITGLDDATSSSPTANPLVTTAYTLTETVDASGCPKSNSVTVFVTHTPVPVLLATNSSPICQGDSVHLFGYDASFHDTNGNPGINAVSFYGDYINGTQTGLSEAAGTVSCWVYVGSTTDAQVAYDLGGAHNFILYIWNDGHIYMNAAGGQFLINDTLTAGNWYHFAMTWSGPGTQFKGYINGHLINGDIVGGSDIQGGNILDPNFNLGRAGDTNFPLQGGMDEFRAYNRVLSQEEIQATMYQPIPVNTPGLKMYFQFNEGSGVTTADLSSNGNTGNLSSGGMWLASTAPLADPSGTTYLWSNGGATTSFLNVGNASTHHVTITNVASGCSAVTGDSLITVNPVPDALTGSDISICNGSSHTIGAASVGGNSYAWLPVTALDDATSSSPLANPTTTTTYTLTETVPGSGCSKSNSVNVHVNPTPDAVVTVNGSASLCPGDSVSLTARDATEADYAVSLTGNDEVTASNSGLSDVAGTISFWVKLNSTSGNKSLVFLDGAHFGIFLWNSGPPYPVLYFRAGNNPDEFYITSPLNAGEWNHVAMTWSGIGNQFKGYINGELITSFTGSDIQGTGFGSAFLNIGDLSNNGIDGDVDEFRAYDHVLTQAEIQAAMTPNIPVNTAGLKVYYRFGEGAGAITSDLTGNGNDGTFVNGASFVTSTAPISNGTSTSTYLWSTTETTSSISVNSTNNYSATLTNIATGCSITSAPVAITVHVVNDLAVTAQDTAMCMNNSTHILVAATEATMSYTLRNDLNDTLVAGPVAGNGAVVTFPTGNLTTTTTYNVLAASIGHALIMDGVDDQLYIPFDQLEFNYTYQLWFNTTDPNASISSVWDITQSSGVDRILFLSGGNINHYMYNSETISSSGLNLADGQWHHAAVVVQTGVGQKIYIDGIQVANGSLDHSDFNWDGLLIFGRPDDGNSFSGMLDDIRIYNAPRTQTQIISDMHQHLAGNEANLVHYWDLDDGPGSSQAADLAGGITGSVFNTDVTNGWPLSNLTSTCPVEMSTKPTVVIHSLPLADPGSSQSICFGASVTLGAASTGGHSYSWTSSPAGFTSSASNPVVAPTTTTTYYLSEIITATSCSKDDSVMITVNPLPVVGIAANQTICNGTSVSLGAADDPSLTYQWSSNPGGFNDASSDPSDSPSGTTTYYLTETIVATNCSQSDSVKISVNSLPVVGIIGNQTICNGSSLTIGAANNATHSYSWTSSPAGFTSTASNPSVSPATTTTYYLTETITATNCPKTDSVMITVNPLPVVGITANQTICNGTSVTIGAANNAAHSYSWTSSPAGFTSTSSNPSVSPATTTTYYLTETVTASNCSKTDSVKETVNPAPVVGITANQTVCSGTSVTIGAANNAAHTYQWSSNPVGFNSTSSNPTVSPNATTTYYLTETITATNCSKTDSVKETVNPLPVVGITANQSICNGTSVTIGAANNAAHTYQWSSNPAGFNSTSSNPTVSPNVTTTYYLTETITATNCSKTDSVKETVNPLPVVGITANQTICSGISVTIGAANNAAHTYQWSSNPAGFNSTSSNPTVSPNVTTTYYLTETITATNCSKTDSVKETVNPLPVVGITANQSICNGTSVTIGAANNPAHTYQWSSNPAGFNSTSSNPTVSPNTTTTYYLTETITASNCSKTDSVKETVNPLPVVGITTNQTICNGTSVTIGAANNPAHSYQWSSNPAGFNSTSNNPTVSPANTTTYYLTETITATNCSKTDSVRETVNPLPVVSIAANQTICNGTNVTIGAANNPAHTYQWSSNPAGFNSTSSNPAVSPANTTTYYLTETITASNCSKMDSVLITVNPLPIVGVAANQTVCSGTTVTIGAANNPVHTYQWSSNPAGFNSTSSNPSDAPSATTTYYLTETITATSCSKMDSVRITVTPSILVDAGADVTLCSGSSTTLNASGGLSYSWTPTTGLSDPLISNPVATPLLPTVYTVTSTGACGTLSDAVSITINPTPLAITGSDTSFCIGGSVVIGAATVSGHTYSWSPTTGLSDATLSNPDAHPIVPTTYSLTETITATGCAQTHAVLVSIDVPLIADAGADVTICSGTSTTLNASGGSTFSWSPTTGLSDPLVSNPVATPVIPTEYHVTAANSCGSSMDSVNVFVNLSPLAIAGNDTAICLGMSVTLGAATTVGNTYMWSPTTTLSDATISNPVSNPVVTTSYSLTETITATGCSATHQVTVTIDQFPLADAGADVTICAGSATTLNASGGSAYSWSPTTNLSDPFVSNPVASPATPTNYSVTVSNACGSSSDVVNVFTNPLPSAIAGNDTVICNGTFALIGAVPVIGNTYSWNTAIGLSDSTISNPVATPLSPSTFTLTETVTATGCSNSHSITIGISTPPITVGSNSPLCTGSTLNLLSGGGVTYSWNGPNGFTSMQNDTSIVGATPAESGTYSVTVTDASGCMASGAVQVLVQIPVNISTTASICQGGAIFLGGAWRFSAGVYVDSLNTIGGCDSVVSTTLIIHQVYSVLHNVSICQGDSLFVGGAYQTGNGLFTDNPMTMFGCDSIIQTQLTVNPVYHLSDSVAICSGDSIKIGGVFRNIPGVYTDSLSTSSGCDSITLRTLIVYPSTQVDLGADTVIAPGSTLIIDAGTGYVSYHWSNGKVTHSIAVDSTGKYWVDVTDANGCASTDTIHVTVGTGISKAANTLDFHVYPNPATGLIFIELGADADENETLQITDITGRICENKALVVHSGKNIFQADLSNYAEGMYFISVKGTFGQKIVKVVLER